MKRLLLAAGLIGCLSFPGTRARAQDDEYVQIYSLIQEADALNDSSQPDQALARYINAQTALQRFQTLYPDWNRKIVDFRLNYLASRIAETTAKTPPPPPAATRVTPSPTNAPAPRPVPPSERTDLENQVGALQNQVRQLQADKLLLEAKLKEAFSAQPAAVDPRQLARAEERIRWLEKENGLLQVTLARQPAAASFAAANTLGQMQRDLAEANQKLAQQTEQAQALALEKQTLQNKLDSLIPAAWNAANLQDTRKSLEDANRRLAQQTELAAQLAREKETLQSRVKTLETDADAMIALRAENELLKKQLADLKRPANLNPSPDATRQLAEARARIAVLESDKEILRLERIALQDRVKQLSAPSVATTSFPVAGTGEDGVRVKQLEQERADLQKKLNAAQKELYGRKNKSAATRIEELAGQLEVLRARLAIFEAQSVPLTDEERALLRESQFSLARTDPRAGQKSIHELPPGAATLAAEARRDFAARAFGKAEEKYIQILQQDDQNVYTLANLAAIQLELNHLDEAEKHVQQALALSPNDAYSLLVLGQISLRGEKYDGALDALSRAAKLDSQNAEIQNYLGLTLSQKGMRAAAETAFRKALQLDPHSGSAHHNLAVFYITQKPPWPELARWHYRKALDSGFPRNPELESLLDQDKTAEPLPLHTRPNESPHSSLEHPGPADGKRGG